MNGWPRLSLQRAAEYQACFGCGQDNDHGFRLKFTWDGHAARSEFTPDERFQGWPGLVHGGIMACLLDEVMGYAALYEVGRCVTARMQIELKKPASIGERLLLASWVSRKSRKLVNTEATVSLEDGTIVAEATGTHFVVDVTH